MIELKFIVLPMMTLIIFAQQALSGLPNTIRLAVDLAAICTLAAGFLVLGRLRGALSASEASGRAWKDERDAAVARADRHRDEMIEIQRQRNEGERDLLAEISELRIEITKLQERPSLEVISAKIDALGDQFNLGRESAVDRIIKELKE